MAFPVQNIRDACEKKGITLAELERKLGIGNGVIARWENAVRQPPVDRLLAIAEELETTLDALQGIEKPAPISESGSYQDRLLSILNRLSDTNQAQLLSYAEFLVESGRK